MSGFFGSQASSRAASISLGSEASSSTHNGTQNAKPVFSATNLIVPICLLNVLRQDKIFALAVCFGRERLHCISTTGWAVPRQPDKPIAQKCRVLWLFFGCTETWVHALTV